MRLKIVLTLHHEIDKNLNQNLINNLKSLNYYE